MILKVERHNETQDWYLLDNIAKVSCSISLHHTKTKIVGEQSIDADIMILDHENTCSCAENEGCSDCIKCYRLVCRTKEHYEFGVLFDTVAYLCNDEGKTIEKIVANYKD